MEKITFNFPTKTKDKTEWDECVRLITEKLNEKLPRKYLDKNGKEKTAQKFTQRGLHFKLRAKKLTLHDLKVIMGTCSKSSDYNWTFNGLIK